MVASKGVVTGVSDELLSVSTSAEGTEVEIADHIERRHVLIETANSADPADITTDGFGYPVDRGFAIDTDQLTVPNQMGVYVRNSMGFMVAELSSDEGRSFPHDQYSLEVMAPVKLYLVFEGSPRIEVTAAGITVELEDERPIHVGARSHHKRPAATVTTTRAPEDLMQAVSTFASALKTTSCERSYPTLRGHPPTIEIGDRLDIPAVLETPDTGVQIEVPGDHRSIYTVATLAYYLGADVVPDEAPKIVTEGGFVHRLDETPRGFEGEVERVLKQVFFLDCVTRTEGFYQVNLHERNRIEDAVALSFPALYEEPLARQLEAYLSIPYDVLTEHLPAWRLTAHIAPDPKNAEALPFVANDLAVVRSPSTSAAERRAESLTIEDFVRRSVAGAAVESAETPDLVRVEETDAMEQTWIGEGAPIGASKGMLQAFKNRLDRAPADGDIDITVVCNSPEMDQERDLVDEVYGAREELPFHVSERRELTRAELRETFEEEIDFLHYIGHIDAAGFECADGKFDAATLDHTNVDVFFLNACTSYQQGTHLIERGSSAGVVTLQDVINSGAERIGYTMARLLNAGFPLRAALNLAKARSIMGGHYLVIGDGGVDVVQAEHGNPVLLDVETVEAAKRVELEAFPTQHWGMGTIFHPTIGGSEEKFLASGPLCTVELDNEELFEYAQLGDAPILLDGEFCWKEELLPERADHR